MTDYKRPALGENVTSGDVVHILIKPGDTVAKDQPILELETDKATIEVPSTVSGTVKEIKVKQGDKVQVGQLVLTVDGNGGEKPAAASGKSGAKGAAAAAADSGAKPNQIGRAS